MPLDGDSAWLAPAGVISTAAAMTATAVNSRNAVAGSRGYTCVVVMVYLLDFHRDVGGYSFCPRRPIDST